MKSYTKVVFLTVILLSACAKEAPEKAALPIKEDLENTKPPANEHVRETPNVTYNGVVEAGGISIYQQGSHRLVLGDDRFILLESSTIDLNGYVGESVTITGSVRPTVEDGGMLMRVENIQLDAQPKEVSNLVKEDTPLLEPTNDSLEEVEPSEPIVDPEQEEIVPVDIMPDSESGGIVPEEGIVDPDLVIEDSILEAAEAHEEDASEPSMLSPELIAIIESMAKDDYSPERWSQPDYCTGHIGFCVPIHKNWWYKSFGNTSSDLWHLELSNAKINSLGEGPIVIRLAFGSIESTKSSDKDIYVNEDKVVGYRSWDDNTHFEIAAHKSLENPVRYLTRELSRYQE